jgi:pentatricopeptide repeat protein
MLPSCLNYNACTLQQGEPEKALDLFYSSVKEGIEPSRVTYNVVLEVLRTSGKHDEARKVYSQMRASNITPDW